MSSSSSSSRHIADAVNRLKTIAMAEAEALQEPGDGSVEILGHTSYLLFAAGFLIARCCAINDFKLLLPMLLDTWQAVVEAPVVDMAQISKGGDA